MTASAPGPATRWLFARQRFGITPGLDGVRALLARLGNPETRFDAVLVAGTNGKGATTAALAEMLRQSGLRTGRFVSPHLSEPGERVVVDGVPMSPAAFEAAAARIRPHVVATEATFFEAVTAMACHAFAQAKCRMVVAEVGMGGRWDATNALEPAASLITSVGLDHTERLGGTVTEVAGEKAGILRAGRPAWTSARGEALDALRARARSLATPLRSLQDPEVEVSVRLRGWEGLEVDVAHEGEGTTLRSPWLGRHQGENLALAALGARALGVGWDAVRAGAASATWPGRLERIVPAGSELPAARLLLDGAHNPDAARALAGTLEALSSRPELVFGASNDKDVRGVLEALAPHATQLHATRARHSPRALSAAEVADEAAACGIPVAGQYQDPREAVTAALWAAHGAGSAAGALVAGSLYLVGEVRPWLLGDASPALERRQ